MREMQVKAYEVRNKQYILLKAPPALGKSCAMMFLELDKLQNQGLKKAIIAVSEKTLGVHLPLPRWIKVRLRFWMS